MPYLKMYPAKNGDAFLIMERAPKPTAILIDGGYANTFHEFISPDLQNLSTLGYALDLVVATHVDADHVSGLLALLKANGNAEAPRVINISDVWHNSLRSLACTTEADGKICPDDKALLSAVLRLGFPMPTESVLEPAEISARQGSSLAAMLLDGGYRWNTGDGTRSINSTDSNVFQIRQGVRLHVIGPPAAQLEQLRRWWIRELQRLGFAGGIGTNDAFDDAFEFLCARASVSVAPSEVSSRTNRCLEDSYSPDTSVTNGSSISVIVEIGHCRMLFLGDGWAENIEAALRTLPHATFPMIFDVIKIAHHGSLHNTSPMLLKMIDSPAWLISSNGDRPTHPDLEVLKAIVDRPSRFLRHLYFNYSTPASQQMRNYTSRFGASFAIYEATKDWIEIGAIA